MPDKTYRRIFLIVCVTGFLASAVLWGYTFVQKDNCSIIDYIAGETK